jgi:hypothetical protein
MHAATKLTMQVRIPSPAPHASPATGRGVRRTQPAQQGEPPPRRLTRPRRPLPRYRTFSTDDRPLADAKEAERHAAEVANGAAGRLDPCGSAGHRGHDHGQVPAEPGGQVQSGDRKDAVREGSPGSAFGTPSCRNECLHLAHIYAQPCILTHGSVGLIGYRAQPFPPFR